ncbi:hypothetical protein Y032_0024g1051 [Ancylostoma ceylanicum]|uniref:PAS domain-containing protein n=1 Tax=Ancylostoma ceylanicum TaxID=53326 RepID=A0A016UVB9_9BILA|nr:hypothetical protein Y032_0024g1051 [Ancylostoma ceylanicum]
MEKRRETSRYAARDRRGKESEIFSDLRAVVPIVDEGSVTHLDRIAVLRVSSAWCRIRKTAPNVLKPSLVGPELTKIGQELWCEDTITEALDGFIIIADSDGTILCVTESVCLYLGLSQTDLVGRGLKEFLHPTDYAEYVEATNALGAVLVEHPDVSKSPENGLYAELRMKTVITQRGRNLNLKSALYKSISFFLRAERSLGGHVVQMHAASEPAGQGSVNAHATALTKYADTPTGSFMTRHTSDMRISYVHDRLNYILRNELKTLMGASFFELIDPNDLMTFRESMKTLFAKGHVRTPLYRLMAANNSVVWVTTEASTVNHTSKGQRAQYVICVHHIAGIKTAMEEAASMPEGIAAGIAVHIKKEVDDTREYAGRQPHVDASGATDFQMQPFTGREDFSVMTRLLSFADPETTKTTSLEGCGEGRSRAYSDTFFRSQSECASQSFGQLEGHSPPSESSLATTRIMATPSRSPTDDGSSPGGGLGRGAGGGSSCSPLAEGVSQCGLYSPPSSARSSFTGKLDRCLGSGQPTTRPRSLSTVSASNAVALSSSLLANGTCDDTSSLLSSLSAAIARSSTNGSLPTMSVYPSVTTHSTPTFEDIPFEEPNLDTIAIRAPYVSRNGACASTIRDSQIHLDRSFTQSLCT